MQDLIGQIMDYEAGEMSQEEVLDLFQTLINSGLCWSLQGSYGRTARQLIDAGLCSQGGRA